MALQYFPQLFTSLKDVLEDVQQNGTWPTTFVSGPSEGAPTHWHSDEVHAYIIEGETDFLDATTNIRTSVKAGDKIVVPARTLHAEGMVKDKVVYVLALPNPVLPEDFLKMHEADSL